MNRFCSQCGQPVEPGQAFCRHCGHAVVPAGPEAPAMPPGQTLPGIPGSGQQSSRPASVQQPAPQPLQPVGQQPAPQPVQPVGQQPAPQPYTGYAAAPAPRRTRRPVWLIGAAGLIVIVLIAIGLSSLLRPDNPDATTTAADTSRTSRTTRATAEVLSLTPLPAYLLPDDEVELTCTYDAPEIIIPANYRSLDQLVNLQCWTDQGQTDVLVSVEIPGFTQKYEQKITVSRLEVELRIHPPLLPDALGQLNSSKDAQLNVVVTDLDRNRIIVQDARPVKLYSRYDMQWVGEDGTPYYENILAWVTPEAEAVRQLLRLSADSCSELTGGELNAIVGYQPVGDWTREEITYVQVACMMHALSAKMQVKYIMAPFSATSSDLQRVATPSQVIESAGGLCAETAVTLASAIQATNMHAVLILLPGHMQVAVETWYQSGEYFLIETTALDAAASELFDQVVDYSMTADDWFEYMNREGYVAIDCDLAEQLHIKSVD